MKTNWLSLEQLISRAVIKAVGGLFRKRYGLSYDRAFLYHDLYHVLGGYSPSPEDEENVEAFIQGLFGGYPNFMRGDYSQSNPAHVELGLNYRNKLVFKVFNRYLYR